MGEESIFDMMNESGDPSDSDDCDETPIIYGDTKPGVAGRGGSEPWSCSPEVRKMLESMGIFKDIETQMSVIRGCNNKRDIDIAKNKLDAISKVMTILKSGTTVYGQSAPDDDDGFSRVVVDITRIEEDEPEEDS